MFQRPQGQQLHFTRLIFAIYSATPGLNEKKGMKDLDKLPTVFTSHPGETHTLKQRMFVGERVVLLRLAGENLFLGEALRMTVAVNWYVEFIDHGTAGKSSAIFYRFWTMKTIKNKVLNISTMSIAGNKHDVKYVMEPTLNYVKWNYNLCSGNMQDGFWIK